MIAERRKIAIIYDYNENWIGSTYYIQNLVCAINKISSGHKPTILVIAKTHEEFNKLSKLTGYPYLMFRKLKMQERIINKYAPGFLFRNFIGRKLWNVYRSVDLLFPATNGVSFSFCKHRLFWVADFQEHYLPDFFSLKEIRKRKSIQEKIVKRGKYIVFSSESARNDFNSIYPGNHLKQFVVPFAVTHPAMPQVNQQDILKKYEIPKDYFICSNQFWKHKNQTVVLKAISVLKKRGKNVFVVFTGKIHDYRNPQYFEELKKLVEDLEIKDNITFLGFISREDQLVLIKNSIAVIQPSLFEGWSTIVEDAKALNVSAIVSNINVHKEQLQSYKGKCFFEPTNELSLTNCIETVDNLKITIEYDYDKDIVRYGNAFSETVDTILNIGEKRMQ